MINELLNSWERRSHCENDFGNAVPRRSRWKRSLTECYDDILKLKYEIFKQNSLYVLCWLEYNLLCNVNS